MRRVVPTAAAAALISSVLAGVVLGATGAPAAATPPELSVIGHGWGHGRGMGQYGAYGDALAGWTYQQILGQYYGGTTLGPTDSAMAAQPVTVRLDELDGAVATAAQGAGLVATWSGGSLAAPAITISRSGGTLSVQGAAVTGAVTLAVLSGDVQLNLPGSGWRSYAGQIVVEAAVAQTWDVLPLDRYVAGVVPSESPASWGTDGMASLQAQAVAARSYALASISDSGGGPICDTPACQAYGGDQDVPGTPSNSYYTTYSDQAVSDTSGQVLRCAATACGTAGSVALAEFSSSTGGWTAGGAFPAVADPGDATPSNPNHSWSTTIPAAAVSAAWPSIGAFEGVAVTSRNGLGDLGGRATRVAISGTGGTVSVSGDEFAAAMGLDSDWFAVTNSGVPSGGLDGYWIVGAGGGVYPFGAATPYGSTQGVALNAPVVGMAPSADQRGYWIVAGDGGIFSFGDATFHGSTGSLRLNQPIIGMAPTPTGGGYWLFAGDGGVFSFGDAAFFGSTGGLRLNQPIVGMASTPTGRGYWLVAADGGIFAFGDAAFHGSAGAIHLDQPVVGMVPTASGDGYTLVARDGGIFTYGDAAFLGSLPGLGVTDSVAAVTPSADGGGYLEVAQSGRVYAFGDAPYFGDGSSASGWPGLALAIFGHRQR